MNHQSTASASTYHDPHEPKAPPRQESVGSGDQELDDLIFSWQRVSDPKLRKIALALIRSMTS